MGVPRRLKRVRGTHANVDGIPITMPMSAEKTRGFIAAFSIDAGKAAMLLPGQELHPFRLWNRGLLLISVIDYQDSVLGKYLELIVGIACTHGTHPAPRLLPLLFRGRYGFGQYILDLPVNTEISVKAGKGIFGLPKRRASLDFIVDDRRLSSQYDIDGQLAIRLDVDRPQGRLFPLTMGQANYSQFRGMLIKSFSYFQGKPTFSFFRGARGSITVGDDARVAPLKDLEISSDPIFTAYYPEVGGMLDDHVERWFLYYDRQPGEPVEGLESVVGLSMSEEWTDPPNRKD